MKIESNVLIDAIMAKVDLIVEQQKEANNKSEFEYLTFLTRLAGQMTAFKIVLEMIRDIVKQSQGENL